MQKMKKSTKYLVIYALVSSTIAVASIYLLFVQLDKQNIIYAENEPKLECPSLAEQLEARAYEIREENKDYDLEKYRHEAIREVNIQLQGELAESPFIDLAELE